MLDAEIAISYSRWKVTVKRAVKNTCETELKASMNSSKLKDGPLISESFGLKDNVSKLQRTEVGTYFRLRSFTTNVKMNRKSDPTYAAQLWK